MKKVFALLICLFISAAAFADKITQFKGLKFGDDFSTCEKTLLNRGFILDKDLSDEKTVYFSNSKYKKDLVHGISYVYLRLEFSSTKELLGIAGDFYVDPSINKNIDNYILSFLDYYNISFSDLTWNYKDDYGIRYYAYIKTSKFSIYFDNSVEGLNLWHFLIFQTDNINNYSDLFE